MSKVFKPKIFHYIINIIITNLLFEADLTYPVIIGGNSQILLKYFKLFDLSLAKDLIL